MGAITPDKYDYDDLAVQYFTRKGWKAFVVAKTGRYSDVLGVRSGSLAIVEVKSPNETSAVKSYDDAAYLSPALQANIGRYLSETRQRVFDLFGSGKSIQKLYAVSIASQLYRYIYEFNEKASEYEGAIGCAVKLSHCNFAKVPFLVVPLEYASEAQEAANTLRTHGYIKSYRSESASPLFVIEATLRS
jgi:hypothetical protein